VDIPIDVVFEPRDAFRATIAVAPPPPLAPPLALPSRTKIWPLAICAFIAFAFATVAFLKSPLALHPKVAPYVNAAMQKIG
jgi:hypothetical protein